VLKCLVDDLISLEAQRLTVSGTVIKVRLMCVLSDNLGSHNMGSHNMSSVMVECTLVPSDVLCFWGNKFSKVLLKQLKCVIVDFYTAVDLFEAKVHLLSDIEALKSSVKFPHVPQRRDSAH